MSRKHKRDPSPTKEAKPPAPTTTDKRSRVCPAAPLPPPPPCAECKECVRPNGSGPFTCTMCRLPLWELKDMHYCLDEWHRSTEFQHIGFVLAIAALEVHSASLTAGYDHIYDDYVRTGAPPVDAKLSATLSAALPSLLDSDKRTITGIHFSFILSGADKALRYQFRNGLPFQFVNTLLRLPQWTIVPVNPGQAWSVGDLDIRDNTSGCATEALNSMWARVVLSDSYVSRADTWIDSNGKTHMFQSALHARLLAPRPATHALSLISESMQLLDRYMSPPGIVPLCFSFLALSPPLHLTALRMAGL